VSEKQAAVSVYFKSEDTVERLRKLSQAIGVSVSSIVSSIVDASLPTLEEQTPHSREVELKVKVRI